MVTVNPAKHIVPILGAIRDRDSTSNKGIRAAPFALALLCFALPFFRAVPVIWLGDQKPKELLTSGYGFLVSVEDQLVNLSPELTGEQRVFLISLYVCIAFGLGCALGGGLAAVCESRKTRLITALAGTFGCLVFALSLAIWVGFILSFNFDGIILMWLVLSWHPATGFFLAWALMLLAAVVSWHAHVRGCRPTRV